MRGTALALVLAAACGPQIPRVDLTLVLPDEPSPAGVTELEVVAQWSGGQSTTTVPFTDEGNLSLPLPVGPVDLTVTGLTGDAGTWRGVARGVDVPASGNEAVARVLFGPIGGFATYDQLQAMAPQAGSAAVPWGEGQVLISGGRDSAGTLSSSFWLYSGGQVELLQGMTSLVPRAHHLASVALDGDGGSLVVLAGGDAVGGGVTASVEVVANGGHALLQPLNAPQRFPSAAVAADGLELFVGCGEGGPAAVDLYLPAAALVGLSPSGWEGAFPLPAPCEQGQVTWLPGFGAAVAGNADLTLLGPDGGTSWGTVSPDREAFGAVAATDGVELWQFGGTVEGAPVSSITSHPAPLAGSLVEPRAAFGWTSLSEHPGTVLIVGGQGTDGGALASAELLGPDGSSVATGSLAHARIRPAVVDISDYGAALVISGEDADGGPVGGLEMYTVP